MSTAPYSPYMYPTYACWGDPAQFSTHIALLRKWHGEDNPPPGPNRARRRAKPLKHRENR